jgi:hypothetical protein
MAPTTSNYGQPRSPRTLTPAGQRQQLVAQGDVSGLMSVDDQNRYSPTGRAFPNGRNLPTCY